MNLHLVFITCYVAFDILYHVLFMTLCTLPLSVFLFLTPFIQFKFLVKCLFHVSCIECEENKAHPSLTTQIRFKLFPENPCVRLMSS